MTTINKYTVRQNNALYTYNVLFLRIKHLIILGLKLKYPHENFFISKEIQTLNYLKKPIFLYTTSFHSYQTNFLENNFFKIIKNKIFL